MFVKPRAGVKVRDPDSKLHVPDEGREVPETSYWLRRLSDGDLVICKAESDLVSLEPINDSRLPKGKG